MWAPPIAMTGVLAEGTALGDYEIVGVAGVGGMGVVYRAKQRTLDRVVALKVIRDEIASAPEYRGRFLREARLAASVDHPNVVPVFDVGEYEGRLLLAMQWVDGEDLRSVLARSGRLAPERAVQLVSQLAGALDAVHGAGLVHRDVKPSNVLIRDVGGGQHGYLTDFGVARPSEPADQLTQTGWVVGTTGYLSPEQIRGIEPDSRSDLYALGCLFFEAVTGQPPFPGDNEMAVRWAHANDPRPLPSAALPSLGQRYDAFLSRALAIVPEQRFASGRDVADALSAASGGQASQASVAPVVAPHDPTVIGPSTPLPPAAMQTPQPQPALHQAYVYATPPPVTPQPARGGNPLALVLLAVVALAGIAAGALIAAGVFSHKTSTASAISAAPARGTAASHVATTRHAPAATTRSTTAPPATQPPQAHTTASRATTILPGSPVTGQDANGYNTGPGCSDDPQTPLAGCADSPSAPNGDQVRSCGASGVPLVADAATTSCGLARNVMSSYSTDGPVTVSDASGTTKTFMCQTGGQGTTGQTICESATGSQELYLRW